MSMRTDVVVGGRPDGGDATRASVRDLLGWTADALTLSGFLLSPLFVPNLGGRFGITLSDILLGFAALARGLHLLTAGIRPAAVRRHSFLLGLLGVFSVSAILGSFAHHTNPLAWPFDRMVIATVGAVLLIGTFGGTDWAANRYRLVRAYAIGCTVLGFSSLYGISANGRAFGYSIHPNALGHSCVMGVAAGVWLIDNARSRNQRLLWAGAVLLNLVGIMQSGSRGALLGLFVGVVIYLALRGDAQLRVAAIAATWLAVMVLLTGVVQLSANNPLQRLVSNEASTTYSNEARQDLLAQDFEIIADDPMWGVGFDDNELIINVHVVYLQGWVGAGAIGGFMLMLLGVTMLLLPFLMARRDLALACGTAAIATAWLFTNILTLRDQWLFIAVVFGSARSISSLRKDDALELVPR
jgi:O-antigen ligase